LPLAEHEVTPPRGAPTGQTPLEKIFGRKFRIKKPLLGQQRPFRQEYPIGHGSEAEQGFGLGKGDSPPQTSIGAFEVSEQQIPVLNIED